MTVSLTWVKQDVDAQLAATRVLLEALKKGEAGLESTAEITLAAQMLMENVRRTTTAAELFHAALTV